MKQETQADPSAIVGESHLTLPNTNEAESGGPIPEVTETGKIAEVTPGIIGMAENFPKKARTFAHDTFHHGGKKYKVLLPQVEIPDLGILTALDVLSDETAQEYLVSQNAIGSVIQEVME